MLILSIVFVFLIAVSFLDLVKNTLTIRIIILLFIGVLLATIAGLRYGDRDYYNYVDIYESSSKLFAEFDTTDIHGEPGYLFVNRICKTVGIGTVGLFMIMSFSSVFLSLNFFRKYSPYFLVAVLIYFSHVFLLRDMMQIRAGLAASISLYALPYIERRRFLPFLLLLVSAALIHAGVLILIPLYIAYPYYLKHKSSVKYLVAFGFVLGLILNAGVIQYLITRFLNIPAVTIYLEDPEYFASLGLLNIVLVKNLILFCFLIYYRKEIEEKVVHFDVFLLCFAVGVFWLSAFNHFAIVAARLATYFSNTEHILLPALFFTRINRFVLWVVIVVYCIVMFASKFEIFKEMTYIFLR